MLSFKVTTMFSNIRFCLLVLLLAPLCFAVLLHRRTTEEVEDDIESVSRKIQGNSQNANSLRQKLSNLRNEMKTSWNDEDNREKISSVISAIGDSIGKLQSDDPFEIATGCLDLLAGITENLGPLSAIAPIFSIISMVVGLFGGGKVQESVGHIVKKALQEQRDDELEAEAFGTQREFTVSKAFLDGVRKEPSQLTEMEVASLSANVPIYKGVKFLAILVQRIKSAEPTDSQGAKRILNFMELLADLCSIRDVILLDLYQLVSSAGHSPNIASGILEVKNVGRGEFKMALEPLFKGDNPKHYLLLSHLYPKDRSIQTKKIFKFFKNIGLSDIPRIDRDISGRHFLAPIAYPRNCLSSNNDEYLRGDYTIGNREYLRKQCNVNLQKLPDGFYAVTVYQNRKAYSTEEYMMSQPGRPNDKLSKFNFLPLKKDGDTFYVISSCEWPDRFAYMKANERGTITFVQGSPDQSGYQTKAFWKIM